VAVLLSGGNDPDPVLILLSGFVLPLAIGLLGVRGPLYRRWFDGYWTSVRRGLVTEAMTFPIGLAALYMVLLYADSWLLSLVPFPTSPFFWALLSTAAVIGFVGLTILHRLLQHRGFSVWPSKAGSASVALPTLRNSWWMMVAVVVIAFGAIALTVAIVA